MGVDLYIGPLSRYLAHDWLTEVMQKFGGDSGETVRLDRRTGKFVSKKPSEWRESPMKHHRSAIEWQRMLATALRKQAGVEIHWRESVEDDYITRQITWERVGPLNMWAAYDERPDLMPASIEVKAWEKDPAFIEVSRTRGARYSHLYRPLNIWLPVALPGPFAAPWIAGGEIGIGSSIDLLGQLRLLNERTWQADLSDFDSFQREECTSFENWARSGFAILFEMTAAAIKRNQPMILDQ